MYVGKGVEGVAENGKMNVGRKKKYQEKRKRNALQNGGEGLLRVRMER